MQKQNKRIRDIRFFSEKNKDLVSVYTALAKQYAMLLEENEQVQSYQTNVPLEEWREAIDLSGIRTDYQKQEWTTDFVICLTDGQVQVREIAEGQVFSLSTAEKLELSRRYWKSRYVEDWKFMFERKEHGL